MVQVLSLIVKMIADPSPPPYERFKKKNPSLRRQRSTKSVVSPTRAPSPFKPFGADLAAV
jgi:hypothetical protein